MSDSPSLGPDLPYINPGGITPPTTDAGAGVDQQLAAEFTQEATEAHDAAVALDGKIAVEQGEHVTPSNSQLNQLKDDREVAYGASVSAQVLNNAVNTYEANKTTPPASPPPPTSWAPTTPAVPGAQPPVVAGTTITPTTGGGSTGSTGTTTVTTTESPMPWAPSGTNAPGTQPSVTASTTIGSASGGSASAGSGGASSTGATSNVIDSASVTKITEPHSSSPDSSNGGSSDDLYTVKSGDTLTSIAAAHGIKDVSALEEANKQITNPNLIYPGETINLPKSAALASVQLGTEQSTETLAGGGAVLGSESHDPANTAMGGTKGGGSSTDPLRIKTHGSGHDGGAGL